MRSVVVYESQTGCTHLVAEAIGKGLHGLGEVHVVPVHHADAELANGVDLLVVGGPTHVHGLSRPATRKAAIEATQKPGVDIEPDLDAEGDGLREWFDALGELKAEAAAFDTRMEGPPAFTGRASKGIAKRLRHHGVDLIVPPESFLVSKTTHLEDGEIGHARAGGAARAAKGAAGAL